MSRKRSSKFQDDWTTQFQFIKRVKSDDQLALCTICSKNISISNGGVTAITRHADTNNHKSKILEFAAPSVKKHFTPAILSEKQIKIALSEAVHTYHVVTHNQSFNSMDCFTTLTQQLFEPKFSCRRTKATAVTVDVLGKYAEALLKEDLEKAQFLTIMTDASNHRTEKMFPVLVRYFDVDKGICNKLLDFNTLKGETSDIIVKFLQAVIDENQLRDKIIAFSADNTNTNFGGRNRTFANNVYRKLEGVVSRSLIGVGCNAHILNNAIQAASDM